MLHGVVPAGSALHPLLLFAATLATTTWAGALHQGVNLWREPARFGIGLPYSLALMAILLVHELGGVKHEPALNDVLFPGWPRRAVGAFAFVLLFLMMVPVPHRFMTALGIVCPYV